MPMCESQWLCHGYRVSVRVNYDLPVMNRKTTVSYVRQESTMNIHHLRPSVNSFHTDITYGTALLPTYSAVGAYVQSRWNCGVGRRFPATTGVIACYSEINYINWFSRKTWGILVIFFLMSSKSKLSDNYKHQRQRIRPL